MAEPVEDDVSLLGAQEATEHNLEYTAEYPGTTKDYRSALRPPPLTPQPRQERKPMTAGRVLGGSASPYSSTSPATSPRTPEPSPNYNIDASGSTYALQVALRNMKDRYHKLQKKMALIEDDNQRLITGKSELFGEIGKLQENSIKLREKNLQLNQEIHTKHQECCTLKEKFSTLSSENMTLSRQLARTTQENRRLSKQVNHLNDENKRLKEKLSLIATQVKALPGGAGLAASASEVTAASRNKIPSDDLDSFEDLTCKFHPSYRDNNLDDYEEVSSNELGDTDSPWNSTVSEEEQMVQTAKRRMKDLLSCLQDQNHNLLLLSPIIHSFPHSCATRRGSSDPNAERSLQGNSKDGTLSQRDRDLSTLTLTPSTHSQIDDSTLQKVQDDEGTCQSRLATYGSVLPSGFVSPGGSNGTRHESTRHESSGDNNVLVDAGAGIQERPQSPFDWRQVQMSDDEGREGDFLRPDTRTVSTSPDPTLEEEDERVCPMCNAVFPRVIPQESFESHVVSHFEVENGFEVIA